MNDTITLPAGTRVKSMATGKIEYLRESITASANRRADDDVWVFMHNNALYEVKLHPGD